MSDQTVPVLPPDLISLEQAAQRLGVSPWLARQLAKRGEFPGNAAIRVGGLWRVSVPKLMRALHGDEAPPAA